jgi:CBS domain-containing protein
MLAKARDVMTREFSSLLPQMTVMEALRLLRAAGSEEGKRISGMVVINDAGQLVGMLSMYDILPLLRPLNIPDWDFMDDQEVDALMHSIGNRVKTTQVQAIMTPDLITITPETHVVKILDIMIRRHIRRLPVVDGQRMVGMVYISDIFDHLGDRLLAH